jgi:integrase
MARKKTAIKKRVRGPDGREIQKTFDNERDANRWVTDMRAARNRGAWFNPNDPTVVTEFATSWAAGQPWSEATVQKVLGVLELYVLDAFGDQRFVAVRPSQAQAWVTSLSAQLSPSYVKYVAGMAGQLFNAAVADGLLVKNPFAGVKLPRIAKEKVVPPTVGQIVALAEAMPERYRAPVIVDAGTGERQAELYGMAVEDVDFLRRAIHVNRQLVSGRTGGAQPRLGPPKTEASHRTTRYPRW